MIFTERFRTYTLPKLTDVSVAALLSALLYPRGEYPPGVFEASPEHLRDSRFAWAAEYIAAEIAAAPGITVDTRTGLGVVWSEIHHPRVANPNMARARGERIARLASSFAVGMLSEISATLTPAARAAMEQGAAAAGVKKIPPFRQKVQRDEYEVTLVRLKRLERELRARFDGVSDLGVSPSVADRRAVVDILSTGATDLQIFEAMEGRAADCQRGRHWEGKDTAEVFLRITWVCSRARRFESARASAPGEPPVKLEIVRNEHGAFFGGRQLVE